MTYLVLLLLATCCVLLGLLVGAYLRLGELEAMLRDAAGPRGPAADDDDDADAWNIDWAAGRDDRRE